MVDSVFSLQPSAFSFPELRGLLKPLFVFYAALICAQAAQAWDSTGHLLVDEIACENVKPAVRARVDALVRTLDNQFNARRPYHFITAGCYMDDMRAAPGSAYAKWHFIDVNYTPDGSGYSEPGPPHVVWALRQAVDTMKNAQAADARKAVALAMILHFVGDAHQPLHCVNWNDGGGNGYFIAGIPFTDLSKKKIPNLHAFWDRAYRFDAREGKTVELFFSLWTSERPGEPADGVIKDQAAKIMARFPASNLPELAKGNNPQAWAKESYVLACQSGYPRGPHPGDNEVVTLPPAFVHHAHEIACRRIALAGYRLANLLNDLFATANGG